MTPAAQHPGKVPAQVSAQEAGRSVVSPLASMNQLVNDETAQTLRLAAQEIGIYEHPSAQRDGTGPRSPQEPHPTRSADNGDMVGVCRMEQGTKFCRVEPGGPKGLARVQPTTTLTRRGGLEMTFRTCWPSMKARAFAESSASRSASSGVMSAGTSSRSRTFPLT